MGIPLSALAASKPIVALVAVVFAFGVVGALMFIGWRQHPMLDIPPRRAAGVLPDELRSLPESDRRRIGVLAHSGAFIEDPAERPLVEAYCRWHVAATEALSFRRMSVWGRMYWIVTTCIYVAIMARVIAIGPALLPLIFVPLLAFRLLVLIGRLPRLLSRKYLATVRMNGWVDSPNGEGR
jgi:hypothetical protein